MLNQIYAISDFEKPTAVNVYGCRAIYLPGSRGKHLSAELRAFVPVDVRSKTRREFLPAPAHMIYTYRCNQEYCRGTLLLGTLTR